jgi:hypothetical protein
LAIRVDRSHKFRGAADMPTSENRNNRRLVRRLSGTLYQEKSSTVK